MKRKFKFREGTFMKIQIQIPRGDVYENSNSNSARGRI